jgi:hypothetical protein
MSDKNENEPIDVDWSRIYERMKAKGDKSPAPDAPTYPIRRIQIPDSNSSGGSEITVPLPDTDAPRGILLQWQKSQIDRATALQAIQAQYDAQLDALRYHLRKAVSVSNARADRIAEEFLKKLDAEHIKVLADLGMRNAETRASALIEVREMIAAKLKEVSTRNWPQTLVDRTIDDLLDLEKRVSSEMMKELGS